MKIELLDLTIRELVAGYHDDGESGVPESKRMSLRMPEVWDIFPVDERTGMNDKEQIELVGIAARLKAVEQDTVQLKSDMSEVKNDVSDMKRDISDIKQDITYMKGKIDVIVDLLGSVVSLIKIPD